MKRLLVWLGVGLVLAAAVALAGWLARFERDNVMTPSAADATYELPPGAGALRVVDELVADGHVRDDLRWRWWVRLRAPGGCLQAGPHPLPDEASPTALFDALCAPTQRAGIRLTLPEGRPIFWVAEAFAEAGIAPRDATLAALTDREVAAALGVPADTLEGYVYPDTYELDPDAGLRAQLARIVAHGAEVREAVFADHAATWQALAAEHGLDAHDAVTIASIVEREAVVADERPMIARVIYNRLDRGMPLQMDPTCTYGPDTWDVAPTRALCRDPANRYSTYVVPALPPGPIASPGRASLEAALAPADDADVLYFVTIGDGSGRHAFANSLTEHNRNVDAWLERTR